MQTFESALLIYNGNAGNNNLEKKLRQILPTLSMAIKDLHIVQTEGVDELKEYCVRYASKVELLLVLGGDGTVHAVINAIAELEKKPIIGILPGGTSNDFCRTLGIPQNLQAAAKTIVAGKSTKIDIAKSNDDYFLNFWGLGLISETSENIDEDEKENLGILSYFLSTFRTVNQSDQFTYSIVDGKEKHEGEAVLIGVFNGRYIGTRQIGLNEIQPDDGKLDVVIVKSTSVASFRELLSIVNPYTEDKEYDEIIHFQADKLRIETKQPKSVDMDGEMYQGTPSEIVLLPGHIQMLHGEDFLV